MLISKATALPIMQAAYKEGKLQVCHPDLNNGVCQYRSPYGPCAVGILLDDHTAIAMDLSENSSLSSMERDELEKLFEADDIEWFVNAQRLHDNLVSHIYHLKNAGEATLYRDRCQIIVDEAKICFEKHLEIAA